MGLVLAWFNNNIPLPDALQYEDIHDFHDYLSTFTIKGNCDIIVIPTQKKSKIGKETSIHIAIELKKPSKVDIPKSVNQGFAQLIQAATLSNNTLIHLRTDLGDIWWFSWFSKDNQIEFCLLNRNESVFFINYFLFHTCKITKVAYTWSTKTFQDFKDKDLINPIIPKKLDVLHENTDIGNLSSLSDSLDENERVDLLIHQRTKAFFDYNNLYS